MPPILTGSDGNACRKQFLIVLFQCRGYALQLGYDADMLGTDGFALPALDTVAGGAPSLRRPYITVFRNLEAAKNKPAVHRIKDIGDGDFLRAAFRAVPAARAGDARNLIERRFCLGNHFPLGGFQRPEGRHRGKIVFHLFDVGHSAEHGDDMVERRSIPERPGSERSVRVPFAQPPPPTRVGWRAILP